MNRQLLWSIVAALLLSLLDVPISIAQTSPEPALRILVTFADDEETRSANRPFPGRNYRYRSRYQVSAAVRRDTRDIADEYDITPVDDWPIESLDVYCVMYELNSAESLASVLQELDDDPRVESVQAVRHFESLTTPTDRYTDSYAGFQHGLESMNVLAAHSIAKGLGVTIAVVDSGVDLQHEDFLGSQIRLRDFVPEGRGSLSEAHGTAVISLIVANPNNGKGIVGVAPAVELLAIRACWGDTATEEAQCDSFTLAKALDFLVRSPPDLINLSIAGPSDPLLGRLIDKALQNGTVIVAARPRSASAENIYPADHAGVLAVSARLVAQLSNHVPGDAILAPGDQIMVALPDDGYDFRSGSSLAAANASGVIALLLERDPGLASKRIADVLRKSRFADGKDAGVINACRALAEIDIAYACQ